MALSEPTCGSVMLGNDALALVPPSKPFESCDNTLIGSVPWSLQHLTQTPLEQEKRSDKIRTALGHLSSQHLDMQKLEGTKVISMVTTVVGTMRPVGLSPLGRSVHLLSPCSSTAPPELESSCGVRSICALVEY